jgi:DNA-binding CsgD family transcriptional regulator
MLISDATSVFESLTMKQHQTLSLAARHLTSKQIAIELGVAPITIDKRIEGVRAKLGAIPRPDLLRLYSDWSQSYGQAINGSIILPEPLDNRESMTSQLGDRVFVFEDSLRLDARASWDRQGFWLRPGLRPSDLGVTGKLLAMLLGAVAVLVVAVLMMAFTDALMSMIMR